jgi:hypothetical protein
MFCQDDEEEEEEVMNGHRPKGLRRPSQRIINSLAVSRTFTYEGVQFNENRWSKCTSGDIRLKE